MLPKKLNVNNFNYLTIVESVNTLIDHLSPNEVKEEWPHSSGYYWYIESDGITYKDTWIGVSGDERRASFGNIFRTKEEAEAARGRIKELLKRDTI